MTDGIDARYFDGRQARGRPVRLLIEGAELVAVALHTSSPDPDDTERTALRWPLRGVDWPERTRHGRRVMHLPDGGSLEVADAAAFDNWRSAANMPGARESWVVRAQQSWRAALFAALAIVVVLVAGYQWGVPLAARATVALLPESADRAVGEAALDSIVQRWLRPSVLPATRQQQLRRDFETIVRRAHPAGGQPDYRIEFRAAVDAVGPNAFALPGGTIVVTDAMVSLLDGADDTLYGVLAHELGHVQRRHGMLALAQVTLLAGAAGAIFGDFSTLLAGVPALLGQLDYSREFERQADADCARTLRAAGLSPAVMVVFFERVQAVDAKKADGASAVLPIALASHPADAERIAFFRAAAAR